MSDPKFVFDPVGLVALRVLADVTEVDVSDAIQDYGLPLLGKSRTLALVEQVKTLQTNEENLSRLSRLRKRGPQGPSPAELEEIRQQLAKREQENDRLAARNDLLLAIFRAEREVDRAEQALAQADEQHREAAEKKLHSAQKRRDQLVGKLDDAE